MPNLYYNKKAKTETGEKLYFLSYLREDFVERSMVISLDKNMQIERIYFSSYKFGSAEWVNGNGLQDCHYWENEDQAEAPTYLTRRYTAKFANGPADLDYAEDKLIPDVLNNMADVDFSNYMKNIIKKMKYDKKLDIDLSDLKEHKKEDYDQDIQLPFEIKNQSTNLDKKKKNNQSSLLDDLKSIGRDIVSDKKFNLNNIMNKIESGINIVADELKSIKNSKDKIENEDNNSQDDAKKRLERARLLAKKMKKGR